MIHSCRLLTLCMHGNFVFAMFHLMGFSFPDDAQNDDCQVADRALPEKC